jgi:flotillin
MGWLRVVTAGPSEALIISGFLHHPPTLIVGGRAFIIPWLQKIQRLQLNVMTLVLHSEMVYTNKGVPMSMTGIAQVEWKLLPKFPHLPTPGIDPD